MPAPSNYPDWGTDETNNVEPPGGKIAEGWLPGEQPPSGWFNWWKNLVGQWTRWLESVTNTLSGRIDDNDADITTLQADLDTLEASHSTLSGAAALKASQNTFTKSQIINTESNWADDPLITTTAKPGDDPTDLSGVPAAAGSNRWKLILGAPTQGDARGGIFIGQSPDGAAMVNNARWHVPTQRWRQIDAAYASTAFVGRSGQWLVSYVPAGAAPWADWPFDSGGDFIAGGNIASNLDFLYAPAKTVTKAISALDGIFSAGVFDADGSGGPLVSSGADACYTVRVPHGAVLGAVKLKVEIVGSDVNATFKTKRHYGIDFTAASAGSYDTVKALTGVTLTVASPGPIYNITIADSGTFGFNGLTANKGEAYQIYAKNNSGGGLSILALEYTMADPGPRNT